ncbi:MAG: dihydrodipicolinate synthase family protein [Acidobacteriota bacterium]|nr:dihydrodipicolinate synthase family protein [Acidobacteriota bacterium]
MGHPSGRGLDPGVETLLRKGVAMPAHPLALDANRKLDERRQLALSRYYCDAGAGGIAVGVHTTQFAIRDPRVALYRPVLQLAAQAMREHEGRTGKRLVKVAGICGQTVQAVGEARFARDAGYDLGLLSLSAMPSASIPELIAHCRTIAAEIPLVGFYLQSAVGGRELPFSFWREFCLIQRVCAIKVAPFSRYQTLEVMRGVAESGRAAEIALYTGNDDNIIPDLLSEFSIGNERLRFAGGLLGQWAVWTKRAAELVEEVHRNDLEGGRNTRKILAQSAHLTDANSALFDTRNRFAGCIAGIHEILRRQGLLAGRWCLDPDEDLSPGQLEEIDRVCTSYPHLNDDEFVRSNLDRWLR